MRSSALRGSRGLLGLLGSLGLALAAACSSGDNTGLVLAIRAPDVPADARRIEVVLASASAADIETVVGQLVGGTVRYYRQKSTAGVIPLRPEDARLDGFVVRIEGRDDKGDEPFVPLVFAYAGDGEELAEDEQPIAAGAVLDGDGFPLALEVPAGSRLEATVDVIPFLPADRELGVMSGQILEVMCPVSGRSARSGVAWQPPAELQLRLLRPAPFGEATLDATMRRLDLDCDGFAAGGDCDDLRRQYNPRAAERCDGMDLNCDGSNLAVEPCILAQAACGKTEGVQLCQEDPVRKFGSCEPSPACQCDPGMCSTCTFSFVPDGQTAVKPCAPGISELPFLGAGACSPSEPCTVEVLRVDGPWRAAVAADGMAFFGLRAVVTKNSVALRLKLDESSVMKDSPSIGSLHLAVSGSAPEPLYVRVDLRLEASGIESCDSAKLPDGDYSMTCK